jgi:hypothetical protein
MTRAWAESQLEVPGRLIGEPKPFLSRNVHSMLVEDQVGRGRDKLDATAMVDQGMNLGGSILASKGGGAA